MEALWTTTWIKLSQYLILNKILYCTSSFCNYYSWNHFTTHTHTQKIDHILQAITLYTAELSSMNCSWIAQQHLIDYVISFYFALKWRDYTDPPLMVIYNYWNPKTWQCRYWLLYWLWIFRLFGTLDDI